MSHAPDVGRGPDAGQPRSQRSGEVRFASDHDLCALVAAFEACDLGAQGFGHQRHVAVAAWYVAEVGADAALIRMRDGLHALLRSQGMDDDEIAGRYHETVTAFWIRLLDHLLAGADRGQPLHLQLNRILERWGDSDPLGAHYRPETLRSEAARRSWVEPDLRPLPA